MALNFTGATPSIDAALVANETYGSVNRLHYTRNTLGSMAALTTCGSVTGLRVPNAYTVPSIGSGVSGAMPSNLGSVNEDGTTITLTLLEYNLGSINLATGTFTAGVSMPTKVYNNASVTTAASFVFIHSDNNATATTPTIGGTYVNQDGTGSRTFSLVLPTNPVATAVFFMQPHLNNGDTGIRSISAMTKSAGSFGIISVRGGLLLNVSSNIGALTLQTNFLQSLIHTVELEAGDAVATYRFGATSACDMMQIVNTIVEPS